MTPLAALLLASAPLGPATAPPAAPGSGVSATARASVEIIRAERVSAERSPEGVERRVKPTPRGLLIEFS